MKSLNALVLLTLFFLFGCGDYVEGDEAPPTEIGSVSQPITQQAADALIVYGRTKLGLTGGQCKVWVANMVSQSYSQTLPANDTSPASDQYKWLNDATPATVAARWLGSYANGRFTSGSIGAGTYVTTSVSVPNNDQQSVVIYSTSTNVTAMFYNGSGQSVSVTSTGAMNGTVSATTVSFGSGTWGLRVTNNGGASVSGVVVVVLSHTRFQSDWQTAQRGDIMQMYVGTGANRSVGGPHTTFVQTNGNANGTCAGGTTTGCNWLDSNWGLNEIVTAHNVSMETFMKMAAYSASYGFTVYRLN